MHPHIMDSMHVTTGMFTQTDELGVGASDPVQRDVPCLPEAAGQHVCCVKDLIPLLTAVALISCDGNTCSLLMQAPVAVLQRRCCPDSRCDTILQHAWHLWHRFWVSTSTKGGRGGGVEGGHLSPWQPRLWQA